MRVGRVGVMMGTENGGEVRVGLWRHQPCKDIILMLPGYYQILAKSENLFLGFKYIFCL